MDSSLELLAATKRQKLRSAWISFAGRIAAQLIGAVATVGLGVVVLSGLPRAATPVPPVSSQPNVLVAKPVRTQYGTVIVLVPLDRYQEVTAETVEEVSKVLATDLSQVVRVDDEPQAETPVWTAAKPH